MESGIYKIVNTVTDKCYVGSAKNFTKRWACHFNMLRKGIHHNVKLQNSYNKYGESVFIPQIIEKLEYTKAKIIERENYWMDELDSKANGYNIADASFGDTLSHHPNKSIIFEKIRATKISRRHLYDYTHVGYAFKGKTHSGETKAKMSEIAKKRTTNGFKGKTHSDETKSRLSSIRKGRKSSNIKRYSIDGIVYEGLAVAALAEDVSISILRRRLDSDAYPTWIRV